MSWQNITEEQKEQYNALVNHPLQAYEWGEFREATGVKVIRRGFFANEKLVSGFQLTIHKIPHTKYTIGYLPKGEMPNEEMRAELQQIGKEHNCIYIQLEPNVIQNSNLKLSNLGLSPSFHPLFTRYTFILDLTKSEEELLKNMHAKTRYNIRVAQKHGVEIVEDNSAEAFEKYWQIMEETTSRQKFYAHTKKYHELQREIFTVCQPEFISGSANSKSQKMLKQVQHDKNKLSYHLLLAKYHSPSTNNQELITKDQILAAWVLFTFHDMLYYPYGSSSSEHRETMSSNLMMWEAIRFGKKVGLKKFDMWGALDENPDTKDPWYGFHKFKQGYGPALTEFVGSYDLVINPTMYQSLKVADKLRWLYLRMKK